MRQTTSLCAFRMLGFCLQPSLVKKTLRCLDAIHPSQSGALVTLLIDKFLHNHQLAVSSMCDTIICRRVEGLLAESVQVCVLLCLPLWVPPLWVPPLCLPLWVLPLWVPPLPLTFFTIMSWVRLCVVFCFLPSYNKTTLLLSYQVTLNIKLHLFTSDVFFR